MFEASFVLCLVTLKSMSGVVSPGEAGSSSASVFAVLWMCVS